ncbi:MAG: hypothetical protein LBR08_06635 [Bacteroidales bacterium]|jgi:hypothetical protein|nr:hypothetical protein [Bacteroidales bacterium]
MKQIVWIWTFALLTAGTAEAKVRRVNNDSGILPVSGLIYTTVTAAVGAADEGDTIHIEGSVTPYTGDVTVDKRLVIIGPGYFLSATPQTQYLKQPARINANITFAAGSESSTLAGVEQVTGALSTSAILANPATYAGNRVIINADTIKIINCRLFYVQIENTYPQSPAKALYNTSIQKCFFLPGVVTVTGANTVTNLSITNCFFRNDDNTTNFQRVVIDGRGASQTAYPLANVRISNNTFFGSFQVFIRNASLAGNVFFQGSTADNGSGYNNGTALVENSVTNNYMSNVMNVAVGGMTNGANGNKIITANSAELLGKWFSRAGSDPFKDIFYTSATNTADCPLRGDDPSNDTAQKGMYGGGTPYVPSGMFKIPSVYDIVMDSEVGDQFDMTIHARVH